MNITQDLITQHGLTLDEYDRILKILGREPTLTELGIFSVMWSEHCSYKSSRIHLKKFPTEGSHVIQGPGENAGVVDIGDGFGLVFKMESHNHPSFIEPYQGAATGVGGILRDVFTMGARPIALLDSLRFGEPTHPKSKFLISGVVSGIAGYGNCVGVPTVGGEIYFDASYNQNILVNAMCLGLVKKDKIFKGKASGVGNPVIYMGAKTGRDGIHGATMASSEFDEKSEEKRPTVQVGDPFTEKLLIEACLELMQQDFLIGIQDMGAAGLTSSSFEMASRAGTGIELELDKVPMREKGMRADELMLSESQERMLCVVKKGFENQVIAIFKKWDLDAAVIGRVTEDGIMRIFQDGKIEAELPIAPLVSAAPVYDRPSQKPEDFEQRNSLNLAEIPVFPKKNTKQKSEFSTEKLFNIFGETLKKMLGSPNLCSRRWVFEQYDHQVQLNTVVKPGSDAAVLRIQGTERGVAATTDCNSRYCFLNPKEGAKIAVAEAARNLVCSGAKPLAITDCLNFGNPEKPEVMWQFIEAVEGISEACRALQTPVTGGNVSLYNETQGRSVFPTPTIGMVGLIENIEKHLTAHFKDTGDLIFLLGETFEELGGSEYLAQVHQKICGPVPKLDLETEKKNQDFILNAIDQNLLKSAHDVSEGGLAVAIAESCITRPDEPIGATVLLDGAIRADALLFGESQSRIVVSIAKEQKEPLLELARLYKIKIAELGAVGGNKLKIASNDNDSGSWIDVEIASLKEVWDKSFATQMS